MNTDPHKMNKQLYSIDVALVGGEKAYKRWQTRMPLSGWRQCSTLDNSPAWSLDGKYRRDPSAPALPSWSWHGAPYWAVFCWIRPGGERVWWANNHKRAGLMGTIQRRPPQAWFHVTRDMGRADYAALQRLARNGAVEPDREGWIPWHGGECPLPDDTTCLVQLRNGSKQNGRADEFDWDRDFVGGDIIAYRIIEFASDGVPNMKTMTPAQRAGFEIGDEGIVIGDINGFKDGQRVTLYTDDGTTVPLWRGSNTWFPNCCARGVPGAYLELGLQVRKPVGLQRTNDGVLTGAAKHRAIADAMDAGEGPEVFEFTDATGAWEVADCWSIVCASTARRKPKTRHLIDANGARHKFPEPMREAPKKGAKYWLAFDGNLHPDKPYHWGTSFAREEKEWLAQGRCHATREARDAHERALIAASGGRP